MSMRRRHARGLIKPFKPANAQLGKQFCPSPTPKTARGGVSHLSVPRAADYLAGMSDPRFIHLRLHTEYSLLEGAVPVKKLSGLCAKAEMPAVAVTDTNNMFAALEFSEYASGAGIQPIIGCQVDIRFMAAEPGKRPEAPAPIVLLAKSELGYENLMKLNSGGPDGPIGRLLQQGQRPKAEALMDRLHEIYGDSLYVELQRHPGEGGLPDAEKLSERGFVEMAYAKDIPLVATNDVYFPKTELYEAHDALICISEGAYVDQQEARRRLTPQHYFKSPQEMITLFADLPEAIENTIEIAKRCALGFPGYFLIVADFIKWAKDHDIPVGPGRGSGAGSLVAYALLITDLDPLRYSLLFERFLNPERVW